MLRFPAPFVLMALVGSVWSAEPELEPIFNGHDLTGWHSPDTEKFWRVEDGVLIGESDASLEESYLWSDQAFGDFVLEFDVRWTGEIDSGVEMREPNLQLQLGVSRSLKRDMSGSFYVGKPGYPESGRARNAAELMYPEGEWNTFRLEARGNTFTVWINGQHAVMYTDGNFSGAAPIGLQIHGGLNMKVEYRKIRAAHLGSIPPTAEGLRDIRLGAARRPLADGVLSSLNGTIRGEFTTEAQRTFRLDSVPRSGSVRCRLNAVGKRFGSSPSRETFLGFPYSDCVLAVNSVKHIRTKLGNRRIDLRPLATDPCGFSDPVAAFDYTCEMKPTSMKVLVELA